MTLAFIPNAITITRLGLVFPFLYCLSTADYQVAFYLFLIAGCSDGLDGLLARRFGWTSAMGAFMDPLADKLLIMGSFLVLALVGKVPLWVTALVIARDIIIMTGVATYLKFVGKIAIVPTFISKVNTALQVLFIFLIVFELSHALLPEWVLPMTTAAMVLTTVASLIDYVWRWGWRAYDNLKRARHA